MKSLIHCCLSSENFILNPRSSEAAVMTHCVTSQPLASLSCLTYWLEYWIAAGPGRCAWKCSWCHPRRSRDCASCASWACPVTEDWHYTSCTSNGLCDGVMYAHIDGFLITGFGIMWWGVVVNEDTHNPNKSDPSGTNIVLIKLYILLSKKKIAMIDEAKAIVKRTMCNQNPLCCNVWSLLGHLIYWLNLFSFDYLQGK